MGSDLMSWRFLSSNAQDFIEDAFRPVLWCRRFIPEQ